MAGQETTQTTASDTLGVTFKTKPVSASAKEALLNQPLGSGSQTSGSHLANEGNLFDVGRAFTHAHIDTGTIVSDKKHARPTVGESLHDAFSEWWGKTRTRIADITEERTVPTRVTYVPKAKTKTHIIEAAIPRETLVPRDDHRVVVQKFRTLKQDAARVTQGALQIHEAPQTPPVWEHSYEASSPQEKTSGVSQPVSQVHMHDQREAAIAPLVTEHSTVSPIRFIPKSPEKIEPMDQEHAEQPPEKKNVPSFIHPQVTPLRDITRGERALRETTPPRTHSEALQTAPLHVTQPETVAPSKPEALPQKTLPPIAPPGTEEGKATPVQATAQAVTQAQSEPSSVATHRQAFTQTLMRWTIVILAILLSVSLGLIGFFSFRSVEPETTTTIRETPNAPTFFEARDQKEISFGTDTQNFLRTLTEEVFAAPGGIVQFYPTVPDGTSVRILTSAEFFGLIGAEMPGKMLRALDQTFMIGSVTTNTNEPFLVLRSHNFEILFAGMLEWERYLRRDLAPLFGLETGVSDVFTDAVRDNASTRVLIGTTGEETLVYSFINKNTVVITRSVASLARILEQF